MKKQTFTLTLIIMAMLTMTVGCQENESTQLSEFTQTVNRLSADNVSATEIAQKLLIEAVLGQDTTEFISPFNETNSPTIRQLADWLNVDYDIASLANLERISIRRENKNGTYLPDDVAPSVEDFYLWDVVINQTSSEAINLHFTLVHDIYVQVLEPVSIFAGDWVGGEDVPAGRYVITGTGSGNFVIWRGTSLHVNQILGEGRMGVTSVTTDIKDGDSIEISRLNEVTFTPVTERVLSNSLTTGHWVVGEDIEAGTFTVTAPSGSGNFVVWRGNSLRTNEILGDGTFAVEQVRVNLENGDRISISGLERVNFD